MAYITALWLAITAPVMLTFLVVAVISYFRGPLARQPIGIATWQWLAPGAILPAIVFLGGIFGSPRVEPPVHMPAAAWIVVSLYATLLAFVVVSITRARRRWTAGAAMIVWLWVGAITAWTALSAIGTPARHLPP